MYQQLLVSKTSFAAPYKSCIVNIQSGLKNSKYVVVFEPLFKRHVNLCIAESCKALITGLNAIFWIMPFMMIIQNAKLTDKSGGQKFQISDNINLLHRSLDKMHDQ